MIHVGTCGWTDPTLLSCGRFYPSKKMKAEDRLKFYAQVFDTVEVDSTFYVIPSEQMVGLQTQRTPPDVWLHYKAYGLLTRHSIDPSRLPNPVKELVGEELLGRRWLTYGEVPEDARRLALEMFRSALLPAASAGKLGVILFQFPPYFTFKKRNLQYIAEMAEEFGEYRRAIEFRHSSWLTDENQGTVFKFLAERGLAYVSVDEPQFPTGVTIPPIAKATSDLAYIRFHGRNTETWFKKGISAAERFSYSYTDDELRGWLPRIAELDRQAKDTFVMFNNCHFDYATANGQQLLELLANVE